jgi:hypothetical protein
MLLWTGINDSDEIIGGEIIWTAGGEVDVNCAGEWADWGFDFSESEYVVSASKEGSKFEFVGGIGREEREKFGEKNADVERGSGGDWSIRSIPGAGGGAFLTSLTEWEERWRWLPTSCEDEDESDVRDVHSGWLQEEADWTLRASCKQVDELERHWGGGMGETRCHASDQGAKVLGKQTICLKER